MEKSLDVTATSIDTMTTHPPPPPSFHALSIPSQLLNPAASLLFSNTSHEVVRIAQTFIALSYTPAVQYCFLLHQLKEAGLHTGKGKEKATTDDDDFPML